MSVQIHSSSDAFTITIQYYYVCMHVIQSCVHVHVHKLCAGVIGVLYTYVHVHELCAGVIGVLYTCTCTCMYMYISALCVCVSEGLQACVQCTCTCMSEY